MKKLLLLLVLAIALAGCGGEAQKAEVEPTEVATAAQTQTLSIEWQRMVDEDGKACCGSEPTRQALQDACARLTESLAPGGMEVVMAEKTFSPEEFIDSPEQANRILIAGHPVAHWLKAGVGTSPCQGFCRQALGEKGSCQTLIYEGETYEVVPADLIVKAGLLAASNLTGGDPCGGCPSKGTCPGHTVGCDGSCAPEGGKCKHAGTGCPGAQKTGEDDPTSQAEQPACPRAGQCGAKTCPMGG